jgi:hypothetical protein
MGTILFAFSAQHEKSSPWDAYRTLTPPPTETGFTRVGERTLTFAASKGGCVEYNAPPLRNEDQVFNDRMVNIYCQFGNGAYAWFAGTAPAAPVFYDVVSSAELVREKR